MFLMAKKREAKGYAPCLSEDNLKIFMQNSRRSHLTVMPISDLKHSNLWPFLIRARETSVIYGQNESETVLSRSHRHLNLKQLSR